MFNFFKQNKIASDEPFKKLICKKYNLTIYNTFFHSDNSNADTQVNKHINKDTLKNFIDNNTACI